VRQRAALSRNSDGVGVRQPGRVPSAAIGVDCRNQPTDQRCRHERRSRSALLLAQPTDTEAVRRLLACIVKDGMRTGDIVDRTRALIKKAPPRSECLEINAVILEAIDVTHDELAMNGVSVQMKLAKDLPLFRAIEFNCYKLWSI